jgi:RimJ/RimL family protein N-acetyltransferase
MQQRLTTERLALHPSTDADLDALWTLWTDRDVRRFLWDDREISRDEAAATLADCQALADQGLGLWTIIPRYESSLDARGPTILGCAGLLPVTVAAEYEPRLAGLVEPVVALFPVAQRHGYAVEALSTLRDHAARQLGLTRLAGLTDVPNTASDRMLRRAGFTPLGECDGPRHRLRTYLYEVDPP